MELTDIAPERLRCILGACRAVFESDRGTYVIVGRMLGGKDAGAAEGSIGTGEAAIEIPKEFLREIVEGKRAT